MWELICVNFSNSRKNEVRNMFGRLDVNQSKSISLVLLEELFYPKNHPWVKTGRKTIQEVYSDFMDYLQLYEKLLDIKKSMNSKQFLNFFKFISPFFEYDKYFKEFIQFGFRYNELKNVNSFQKKYLNSKLSYGRNDYVRNEEVSIRTNL